MKTYTEKTQRGLRMTHSDKDLKKIYNDVFADSVEYMRWGGITKAKEQDNETLHATNTERLVNYEK